MRYQNSTFRDEGGASRRELSSAINRNGKKKERVAPNSGFVLALISIVSVISLTMGVIYGHFLQINQTRGVGECVATLFFLDSEIKQSLSEDKIAVACELSPNKIKEIKEKLKT